MGVDILALVAIVLLAPLALYGAWALWTKQRGSIALVRDAPRPAPIDPWQSLPLAIAGFDSEDRLLGASRAFRDELGARGIVLDDVLKPGIAAQALFDAWIQRSGGTISPVTAIATLPAHELTWPANVGRAPHRLACVALHDAAGATYRLLVDPAILNAAPIIQVPDSAADTRAIIARNAVLASALQSITIGVALCDATAPEATILYVNPAFGRITGYETQEVIGQPLRFLQGRGTPQDQVERLERALIQRRAANLLLRSQRKDGKPFWNDMHVNPILEDGGHVAHFVAFITDASPRIRAEENLREAKHVAEIANRAKSDILDLSKIEAGRFQLHVEPVDIEETFEDCARLVRERAENAGLQVVRRIDPATPRLIADKRAVKQILINLLSNAIKFTPQGGQVTLSAQPAPASGWVALSVADTGIGIPPEQIDNALSAFGQVDNPFTRSQEGTGLGLPIVKSLVELHSGQFQIESAVGKGTKITMIMPAQKAEVRSIEAQAAHGS
jgi:PAS domain S-box-containing protein